MSNGQNELSKTKKNRFFPVIIAVLIVCIDQTLLFLYTFIPDSLINILTVSFALISAVISSIMVIKFIIIRIQKKAVKTPIFFILLLMFSVCFMHFLWVLIGTGFHRDYLMYKAPIKPSGKPTVIHRIRKCELDAGDVDHSCKNIIMLGPWKHFFSWRIVGFQPQGKNMSIKDGWIYFHQEGCCSYPDLITVIDGRGRIVKTCDLKSRLHSWGEPVTQREWQTFYNCRQRKCTKDGYCGKEYGNRDRKLRGQ